MFNLQHVLYMVISAIVTALLLWLCARKIKTQRKKDLILKLSAIVTVIVHISDAYVNFFKNAGVAYVDSTHIFPIFPCNIIMWMLLIAAFTENKNGRFCVRLVLKTNCHHQRVPLYLQRCNAEYYRVCQSCSSRRCRSFSVD